MSDTSLIVHIHIYSSREFLIMKTAGVAVTVALWAACFTGSARSDELALDSSLEQSVYSECCDSGCGGIFRRWQERDPWTLPQPCFLERLGVRTGGWFEAGITMNAQDPPDRFNGPVLTNDRHNDLQMHQLWLHAEKPCDTGGCGFDLGGRLDVFFGSDWRVAYAFGFGLEDRINNGNEMYGLGIPQFYIEAMWNKLSVKAGRMAGIFGYEMIPPMGNFFYSRSYQICYTEPLLMTGMLAEYPLTDRLTAHAGVHLGYRRFDNNNDKYNFHGGLKWTSCDGNLSLAYALDTGQLDNVGDQYLQSVVFVAQLTDTWRYALHSDLGVLDGAPQSEWYGVSQTLVYTINDRWSAGLRVEWFRDDDGTAIFGVGNLPEARGWLGAPGYAGDFTGLSLGLNWKPKPNVFIRPEVRWDAYSGPANLAGPAPLPFDGGTSRRQFLLAADLVVVF